MPSNAFTAGVDPGGLTNDYEIRILICYAVNKVDFPINFEQLAEVFFGFVNYFEYAQAVSELRNSGNIYLDGDGPAKTFKVSVMGKRTAEEFEGTIPAAVKEKILERARAVVKARKLQKENIAHYERTSDGFNLTLRITDAESDLLNLTVFIPTEELCKRIIERFKNDPLTVYESTLKLLGLIRDR